MKKLFFFIAAMVVVMTANAAVVNAHPNGGEAGVLSWFLGQVNAGDTLIMADGEYNQPGSLSFNKEGLVVMAAEGAKPVIALNDEGGWTTMKVEASTTFDGVCFDGKGKTNYPVYINATDVKKAVFNNCEFKNYFKYAISDPYGGGVHVDSLLVNNCLFHDGGAAVYMSSNGVGDKATCDYFEIKNSTIYKVTAVNNPKDTYFGMIHVSSLGEVQDKLNEVVIDHVTIYDYTMGSLGAITVRKSTNLKISNSIIANPAGRDFYAFYIYGGTVDNTFYFNGKDKSGPVYTGCKTDDPMFKDAANGDFTLLEGSPALTAATDGGAIGDPRWNVVAEPEPVVYNVTVTAENGTVEGAGEYEEGKTATLTATPAEGYQFVNWTVGEEVVSTENPYSFVVTANIALVANFELIPVVEPEKPEPTYTENNLNPYAFGLESELVEGALNVTYRLNNSNATSVNVIVYNGEEVVATVAGTTTIGKNTVEVPTADLPGGVELTWGVEVNGTSVKVPTQEEKNYGFYCPHGLAIDTNPESENFGRILVAEAMHGNKGTKSYVSHNAEGLQQAGLYTFNPSFTTDSVVYTGGLDFTRKWAGNGYQPWRVKISEDGRIFVSSLDLNGVAVWEVSKDLQTWTPVIAGTQGENGNILDAEGNFVAGMNVSMDVKGSGEDLTLLLYSCTTNASAFALSAYRLDEYHLGTATTFTGTPKNIVTGGYAIVHTNAEFIYDGEGGYWFGASRSNTSGTPAKNLAHINAEGVEDYSSTESALYGGDGVLVHNGMLFKGKARTSGTVGNFGVWTIGKDADGKVTLTEKWTVAANGIGRNLNEFAVDYAENLYVVGNSGEMIIAYALPYSGKVETPAAAKYAFQLEAAVVEPVELVGVVKRALTIGESTVVLTHEADGTPHIYNIVGEEIAEVSQVGVIARDPENPGDHLAISDIAVTEDGKLVAVNYVRCYNAPAYVESGYKEGTTRFYMWDALTADPTIWFTSQYTSNSLKSDQGYTMALNGSSTDCQIIITGVHRYGNGARFSNFKMVNGALSSTSYFGWLLGLGSNEEAVFDEAIDGTNFQLSVSPRNNADFIMDAEKMAPVEWQIPATSKADPIVLGELDAALVGKKFNGATYVTIDDQVLMVAPYATAEGLLAGVKVLDITAGLASATEVAVADLDAAVEATAAATAVVVDEDKLIITLVGDATLYTLTAELTQDPGPGTALDNIAVEAKTIKMIKNGQLIIIKNGVQYNVQGQVIK